MQRFGMKQWAVFVLAGALLTACSSAHQIDRAAWAKDLAAQDDPSTFLAVFTDGGTSLKQIETDYRNACPDRMDRFQAGVKSLAEAKGSADLACNTAADKRTQDQADLAEAMGCK